MRLYHPNLKPPDNEYVTQSDDPLHVQVYLDMGWLPAPEPEAASPHVVAERVQYAPVESKAKPASKATKSTAK